MSVAIGCCLLNLNEHLNEDIGTKLLIGGLLFDLALIITGIVIGYLGLTGGLSISQAASYAAIGIAGAWILLSIVGSVKCFACQDKASNNLNEK